jgi:hypothetical protein
VNFFHPALFMKLQHTLLAVFALCAPALAQQTPPPAAPAAEVETAGLRVRGLSFQLDSPPADVFVHDAAGDGSVPGVKLDVKSYLNHEFSGLPIKGDSLVLTKTADPAGIKDSANIVAKTRLPAGFRSGIFMLLPGSGGAGDPPFRVLVIDDSKKSFPPGSLKILNLSPLAVSISLEKEVFNFKSGETRVIEDPPVGPSQSSGMIAKAFKDGEWRKIGSGIWPHPGSKRILQVLFENPTNKQVELRGIRDIATP